MSLTEAEKRQRWSRGGGAFILVIIAFPLFREFSAPGNTLWNVFLGLLLLGLIVAALLLQRFFATHADEIGEARFDTRNKSQIYG